MWVVIITAGTFPGVSSARDRSSFTLGKEPITIRGEVWDSVCAASASHEKMIAKAKDAKECTPQCLKAGDKLVLFNPDDRTTYELDDQDKANQYARQTVTVTGSYDRATNTIRVTA